MKLCGHTEVKDYVPAIFYNLELHLAFMMIIVYS